MSNDKISQTSFTPPQENQRMQIYVKSIKLYYIAKPSSCSKTTSFSKINNNKLFKLFTKLDLTKTPSQERFF